MPTIKLDRHSLAVLPGPEAGKSEVIHWDEGLAGLGLRVLASGARSWIVRYRIGAKQRVVTLGKGASLSTADARKRAGVILAKAKIGQDTRTEIAAVREGASETFVKLAESYIAKVVEGRRKPGYVKDVRRYLLIDAKPLHPLPVAAVTRKRVAGLLDDLAGRAPVAADRCRVALATLFTWAMRQGLAEANPAAAVARVVEPKARDRVLSPEELRAVWEATDGPGDFNAAVRLLMLTGQRREEVGAAAWSEIDATGATKPVWNIPGERTKNGRAHAVPLSAASLALLEAIPRRSGRALVFGEGAGGFSGWSKAKAALDARIALARAKAAGRDKPQAGDGIAPWRLHDIRRSVVTHMAETGIPPHVIEAVVNHVSGHKAGVAGVYNRATYAAEKRVALQAWGDRVTSLVTDEPARVVPLRREIRSAG